MFGFGHNIPNSIIKQTIIFDMFIARHYINILYSPCHLPKHRLKRSIGMKRM